MRAPILRWWMVSLFTLGQVALVAGLQEDISATFWPMGELAKLDVDKIHQGGDYTYDDLAIVRDEKRLGVFGGRELGAGQDDDPDCVDNPAWTKDCQQLKNHCEASKVMKMKCRKTCGCGPIMEDIIPHVDTLGGLTKHPGNATNTTREEMGEMAVLQGTIEKAAMIDAEGALPNTNTEDMSLSWLQLDEQVKKIQDDVQRNIEKIQGKKANLGETAKFVQVRVANVTDYPSALVCADYPDWAEHCEILKDQCSKSYVMQIKCRKSCGCGPFIPDPLGPPPSKADTPAAPKTDPKTNVTNIMQERAAQTTAEAEKKAELAEKRLEQEEEARKALDAKDKAEEAKNVAKGEKETEAFNDDLKQMQKDISGMNTVAAKTPNATDLGENQDDVWSESLGDSDELNMPIFVQTKQITGAKDSTKLIFKNGNLKEKSSKSSMKKAMAIVRKVAKTAVADEMKKEEDENTSTQLRTVLVSTSSTSATKVLKKAACVDSVSWAGDCAELASDCSVEATRLNCQATCGLC